MTYLGAFPDENVLVHFWQLPKSGDVQVFARIQVAGGCFIKDCGLQGPPDARGEATGAPNL